MKREFAKLASGVLSQWRAEKRNLMQVRMVYALLHYGGIYYLIGILSVYANWPIQSPFSWWKPQRVRLSALSFFCFTFCTIMDSNGSQWFREYRTGSRVHPLYTLRHGSALLCIMQSTVYFEVFCDA